MDLTSNLIAQTRPTNQFHFDAEAFDRAILRAEKRRAGVRRLGAGFGAGLRAGLGAGLATIAGGIGGQLKSIIKMAPDDRPA